MLKAFVQRLVLLQLRQLSMHTVLFDSTWDAKAFQMIDPSISGSSSTSTSSVATDCLVVRDVGGEVPVQYDVNDNVNVNVNIN